MDNSNKKKTEAYTIHTSFPTISEQITGNYFGWGKVKKGTRWIYVIGLIINIIGILVSIVSAVRLIIISLNPY